MVYVSLVHISFFTCLVLPVSLGYLWGDVLGAFVWGSLVARVIGE